MYLRHAAGCHQAISNHTAAGTWWMHAVALQEASGSLTRHIMNRQMLGAGSRSASLAQGPGRQSLTGLGVFHPARGHELLKLRRQVSLGLPFQHGRCCTQAVIVSEPGSSMPAMLRPSHA